MPGYMGQIGLAEETTPGTRAAPTLFLPLVSESLADTQDPLTSAALRSGSLIVESSQRNGGTHKIGGDFAVELTDNGLSLLFKHLIGAVSTTGSGTPYTHTFTPAAVVGKALTIQKGVGAVGASVWPFDFLGCKVTEWELAVKAGEIATLSVTVAGMKAETSDALATVTYPVAKPVKFLHGGLSLGGNPVPVSECSIKFSRNVNAERFVLGSAYPLEPVQDGMFEITSEATCEFVDMTLYNAYVNHTDLAYALDFTIGSNSVGFNGQVRLDDCTPNIDGSKIVTQKLPMTFVADDGGAASTAFEAVVVDGTATP